MGFGTRPGRLRAGGTDGLKFVPVDLVSAECGFEKNMVTEIQTTAKKGVTYE